MGPCRSHECFKPAFSFRGGGGGGGGVGGKKGTKKSFTRGGFAPRSNFYIPFLTEKIPLLLYLLLTNDTPFTYLV